jgi:hypothetical protein
LHGAARVSPARRNELARKLAWPGKQSLRQAAFPWCKAVPMDATVIDGDDAAVEMALRERVGK